MTNFRSRRSATVAAATILALIAGMVFLHVRRDREWAHGGDRLTAAAEVVLTTAEDFDRVVVQLGVPPGEATRWSEADQTVVVRVRWSGLPQDDGSLEVIALDKRVTPPRLLTPDAGWNSEGGTGSGWGSAYEPLAEHYDWLRGVAGTDVTGAVYAPGTGSGTVTAWFRQSGVDSLPFRDPAAEILVGVFAVDDDGEVRWARRIHG